MGLKTMPKQTPPTEETPNLRPKPWVFFNHPYGDFPEYKRGDTCYTPSEEMLRVAQTSSCLTIIKDNHGDH